MEDVHVTAIFSVKDGLKLGIGFVIGTTLAKGVGGVLGKKVTPRVKKVMDAFYSET